MEPIFASCDRSLNRYFWETFMGLRPEQGFFYNTDFEHAKLARVWSFAILRQTSRSHLLEQFLRTCVISFFFREDTEVIDRCIRLQGGPVIVFPSLDDDRDWPWPWSAKEELRISAERLARVTQAGSVWCMEEEEGVKAEVFIPVHYVHLLRLETSLPAAGPPAAGPCYHISLRQVNTVDDGHALRANGGGNDAPQARLNATFRKYLVEFVRFQREVDYWTANLKAGRIAPRAYSFLDVADEDLPNVQVVVDSATVN